MSVARDGIGLAIGIGVGLLIGVAQPWEWVGLSLETACAEAANEPAPVTEAGKHAAFGVMFACRYGGKAAWARFEAHENLAEWRRAEAVDPPLEHSAADIIERRIYGR